MGVSSSRDVAGDADVPMSLGDHLHELRRRIILPIALFALFFVLAFAWHNHIKLVILQPLVWATAIIGPEKGRAAGLGALLPNPLIGAWQATRPAPPDAVPDAATPTHAVPATGTPAAPAPGLLVEGDALDEVTMRIDERQIITMRGRAVVAIESYQVVHVDDDRQTLRLSGTANGPGPRDVILDVVRDGLLASDGAGLPVLLTRRGPPPAPKANAPVLKSLSVSESAWNSVQVSYITALVFTIPVVVYSLWRFVSVGLIDRERRLGFLFVPAGVGFFYLGAVVGYLVGIPYFLSWFMSWQAEDPTSTYDLRLSTYYETFTWFTICFGLVMDIPWLVMVLVRVGIFTCATLASYRKVVLMIVTVLAGIMAPPDAGSMIIMMIPMYLLFELGLLLSRIMVWRQQRREAGSGHG